MRCNQVGYLPDGPKRAVWVTDAEAPAPFRVLDRDGGTIATGATVPWAVRPEPTSGLRVHELEFSGLRAEGAGFVVEVGGARSHPFAIAPDLYAPLRDDALRFFYLQRSGVAIDDARAPGYGRPAGHAGDAAVAAWSGADARRLYPGWSCPGRFDASGGWYDAGDHGKYVTSGAMAVWQLLATIELLRRRGADPAAEAVLAEECRWQLDWLLRMQVPPGRMHAGLAFHRLHGTEWAPLPCRPHEDPTTRVLHRPSTAAALHVAAAAAHGARVFAGDVAYARRLLEAATTAYRAAQAEPELLAPDDHGAFGGGPYAHDDLGGDWAWAAAELWLASRDPAYAATAARAAEAGAIAPDGFDCDRMGRRRGPGPRAPRCAGGDTRRRRRHGDRRGRPPGRAAGRIAVGRAVRAPGRLGLGLQRADPRQPRRPRGGARAERARGAPRCRRPRDGPPAGVQRARPELRHRLRHRRHAPPAHAPLRPRPRPVVPAAAARRARRRAHVEGARGLSDRPAPARPSAAAVLPRRADVRDDERRLHPLERPARPHGRLPHAGVKEAAPGGSAPLTGPTPRRPPASARRAGATG